MPQAKIIDIHRYYRTGGVNPQLLAQLDGVIIQGCVGLNPNPLLREQAELAIAMDVPFATYAIFSPQLSLKSQVLFYLSLPLVRDGARIVDIESPSVKMGIPCINNAQAKEINSRIEQETQEKALQYINPAQMNALGKPSWMLQYWIWLAAYPWRLGWPFYKQYEDFDSFLARYPWTYPSYVRNTPFQNQTILWQYSCEGDAPRLIANQYTADPVWKVGIKKCDLNVSLIEADLLVGILHGTPPPPLPPPTGDWYYVPVTARNIRETPNSITGKIITTLHKGDKVQISGTVKGYPGTYGVTIAYQRYGANTPCLGNYIYMNNLKKV